MGRSSEQNYLLEITYMFSALWTPAQKQADKSVSIPIGSTNRTQGVKEKTQRGMRGERSTC